MRIKSAAMLAIACVFTIAMSPLSAHAYRLSGFGAKAGLGIPEDLDGSFVVGGHMEFAQGGSRLHLMPNVMYWNSNDVSDVAANFDLYYHFDQPGLVSPYVGAGLGMNFYGFEGSRDSDSSVGANLFGGVLFPSSGSHYFLEGRYTAADISHFAVLGGVTFHR